MQAKRKVAAKKTESRQGKHERKLEALKMMDKIASKSKLTMKDVMEFDKKIKEGMNKEFRKQTNEKSV